jgi:hypothetical protein
MRIAAKCCKQKQALSSNIPRAAAAAAADRKFVRFREQLHLRFKNTVFKCERCTARRIFSDIKSVFLIAINWFFRTLKTDLCNRPLPAFTPNNNPPCRVDDVKRIGVRDWNVIMYVGRQAGRQAGRQEGRQAGRQAGGQE